MSSLLRFNAALTARNRPLTGDTKSSFVLDDHLGWLKCDGRGMDKVVFNLLFQVIGYQFGGSGNTFNLPDLQGRVMGNTGFVTDQNSRTRTFAPGTSIGELDHKLIQSEMPSHNHDINGLQSNAPPVTGNGSTSSNATGITHNGTGPLGPGRDGYGLAYQDGHSTMNAAVGRLHRCIVLLKHNTKIIQHFLYYVEPGSFSFSSVTSTGNSSRITRSPMIGLEGSDAFVSGEGCKRLCRDIAEGDSGFTKCACVPTFLLDRV